MSGIFKHDVLYIQMDFGSLSISSSFIKSFWSGDPNEAIAPVVIVVEIFIDTVLSVNSPQQSL